MPALPGIHCEDATVRAALTEWLAESRMRLPTGLSLRVEVSETIEPVADPREVYEQGDVAIRAGEPLGWVHLSWRTAPAWARIDADRAAGLIVLSPAAITRMPYLLRSFILVALIFLWKRDRRYHVHAATAVDRHGRGWMLIGNSCSGKSTTTALLAARGWRVSTDDIAFLVADGERVAVEGFRSPIALRPGGVDLIGHVDGVAFPARGKTGVDAESLGGEWIARVTPEIVLFTSVTGDATTLTAAAPGEIIREMLQWSMWVLFEPTAAQEHLELLMRLGAQARCYRAALAPDLFTAPNALEDFLP